MSLIDRIFDKTFTGLQRTMDLTWRRNEVITSNITNAETPQYRAADFSFAGELDRAFGDSTEALKRTSSKHLDTTSSSSAHITPDLSGATKADGNNVDIEIQMGQMASNSGKFSVAADLYRRKLSHMKMAIREAGR